MKRGRLSLIKNPQPWCEISPVIDAMEAHLVGMLVT